MSKYNKIAIAVLAASAMISGSAMAAKSATAMASWAADAIKTTDADLVVTPLGTLTFNYAPGTNSFNEQKGLFDVSIKSDISAGATDAFTLTAEPVTTSLTSLTDGSTLNVGVEWYGKLLNPVGGTITPETIIDVKNGISGNGLAAIGTGAYDTTGGTTVSAQDSFKFRIISATPKGGSETTDMSTMADGKWKGDVSVRFVANWA